MSAKKVFLIILTALIIVAVSLFPLLTNKVSAATGYCSGGTTTYVGSYVLHTFLYTGLFSCPGSVTAEVLVVGGGGGGGYVDGGGGGAGAFIDTTISIPAGSYTATVGAGGTGAAAASAQGANGYDSSVYNLTAKGGGGGGSGGSSYSAGVSGGSGGGGAKTAGYGAYGVGSGSVNSGGNAKSSAGGGGGGASANGADATSTTVGGNGGNGQASSITGGSVTYAGGGGGGDGSASAPTGGSGGGGVGGSGSAGANGGNATVNTGSGGGGGSDNTGHGGNGGSGIIIISYLNTYLTPTSTPTNTPTVTNTGTIQPTNTPTQTFTPSPTFTTSPTFTLTPSLTNTLVSTPTSTYTPNPGITWAPSGYTISNALKNAAASRLLSTPPSGVSGTVYGILGVSQDGSGGWFISLAALDVSDLDPPYTGWNVMTNAQWMDSLDCSGSEPAWSCIYYVPPEGGAGGPTGLIFPFQPGTWAKYGPEGIHHDGNGMLPGDSAVDFMGDDAWSGSMGAYAYAAASGTVVAGCNGAHQGGIVISGPSGRFMYFHLLPAQPKMAIGTQLAQGELIGSLAYGSWNDTPCGISNINSATGYHLHFAFLPSGGFLQMGGCALNLSTQNWLCGTQTVAVNGTINNGGNVGPAPTVTPGGPTVTPGPNPPVIAEGGEHVWNGLIDGFISMINNTANKILPAHSPSNQLQTAMDSIWPTFMDFAGMINGLNMLWIIPGVSIYGLILSVELVRWIYVIYRWIVGLLPMP